MSFVKSAGLHSFNAIGLYRARPTGTSSLNRSLLSLGLKYGSRIKVVTVGYCFDDLQIILAISSARSPTGTATSLLPVTSSKRGRKVLSASGGRRQPLLNFFNLLWGTPLGAKAKNLPPSKYACMTEDKPWPSASATSRKCVMASSYSSG